MEQSEIKANKQKIRGNEKWLQSLMITNFSVFSSTLTRFNPDLSKISDSLLKKLHREFTSTFDIHLEMDKLKYLMAQTGKWSRKLPKVIKMEYATFKMLVSDY